MGLQRFALLASSCFWLGCSESSGGGSANTAQASSGMAGGPSASTGGPGSVSTSGVSTTLSVSGAESSSATSAASVTDTVGSGGQPSSTTGDGGLGGASVGGASSAVGGSGGATLTGSVSAVGTRGAGGTQGAGGTTGNVTPSLLVFSRTLGYRHASIPIAIEALEGLAENEGWQFAASEDASVFSDETLAPYNVLVMLSPTGDILDSEQQAAFERYIQAGNGFVGIHAASDTEFDWAWYGGLVGAYFEVHPDIQEATLIVEDATHPSTAHLPETWVRTDEWYGFVTNPRPGVTVLISIDETSYSPGDSEMGGDHPIAWYHEYDGGRSFYTALGHTSESYGEPEFMAHLKGAIAWAAGASE